MKTAAIAIVTAVLSWTMSSMAIGAKKPPSRSCRECNGAGLGCKAVPDGWKTCKQFHKYDCFVDTACTEPAAPEPRV